MADEKTVIAAFQRTVPPVEPRPQAASPSRPKKPSAVPIIAFGLAAALLLAAAAGLILVQIRSGEDPVVVTDAELENDLVMIEAEAPPPTLEEQETGIIELSGNPVILKRNVEAPIQRMLAKVEGPAGAAGKTIGVDGEIFRLVDALTLADTGLTAGMPSSQQSLAFFLSSSEEDEALPADQADATQGAPPTAEEQDDAISPADQNTSILTIDSAAQRPWTVRDVFYRAPGPKEPASALLEWGFDAESAKQAAAALAAIHGIKTFDKGDEIALRGFSDAGEPLLTLAQLSISRGGEQPRILARTEQSTYVAGVDPWRDQDIFEEPVAPAEPQTTTRLLDAIYGAAVRNDVPTPVIGEALLLLSRSSDLEQPVVEGQRLTLLYNTAPRDKKTGLGRVLFVRIDRAQTSIECFAFQSKPGAQFECISGDGQGIVSDGGMVTPVKGVISAKFGARNSGVDWAAPAGTPVRAAFAGTVKSAAPNGRLGTMIEIAHEANRKTVYGYLQGFAGGISSGVEVRAGQVIGFVGKTGKASEPTLRFELYEGEYAVDPFGEYQRVVERGGAVEHLVNQIIRVESAGNPRAKNPLSSAAGLGQFINSTWLTTVRTYRPSLFEGRTVAQVLDLRYDPVIARDMLTEFTRENERYIRARGVPSTPGNLYLAHFLGTAGAVKAVRAHPDTSLLELFGAGVINANGFLRGKSAGYVVLWAARKMAGKGKPLVIPTGTTKPILRTVADPDFAKLKQAVATMMQGQGMDSVKN